MQECLDDKSLTEAFELFDSDHDGKINLEEFEFFMSGFARDMNKLRDNTLVQTMVSEAKKHADDKDHLLEISTLVQLLKDTWKS